MKLLKLSLLLILALSYSACDDDDNTPSCMQSDWVGIYEGTIDCDGTTEDVTVTITASGEEAIIIKYETATVTTEFDPLTPDGCDLDVSSSDSGFTLTVDATLDGDQLDFREVISFGGTTSNCDIMATRN